MNAPTDETLLREYLAGREAGFELLVRRYSSELYRFAVRFTRNGASAEDIVQESFLQVSQSAAQFDGTRRFKPWLFTIAANKARDWLRSRTRKREVPLDAKIDENDDTGRRFSDLLERELLDVSPDADLAEKQRLVKSVLAELPRPLWEVLTLAYFCRFPYRDIAEILGIPLGTVKSRLHAAVTHFGREFRTALETSRET